MAREELPPQEGKYPRVDQDLYALDEVFTRLASDDGTRRGYSEALEHFGLTEDDLASPTPEESREWQKKTKSSEANSFQTVANIAACRC